LDAAICLHSIVMPHIKAAFTLLVESSRSPTFALSSSAQTALSAAPSPVILLAELLSFVLVHPQQAAFPLPLHISICSLIGGSVFLLAPPPSDSLANQALLSLPLTDCGMLGTSTGPSSLADLLTRGSSLLVPTIEYLFCCLELAVDSPLLRNAASQSLFRVFTHSAPASPLLPMQFHHSLTLRFAALIELFAQKTFSSAVLIQTVSQHIARYPPERACSFAMVLAQKIQSLLQVDLNSDPSPSSATSPPPRWFLSPTRVTLLLQMIAQFIRHSPPLPALLTSPTPASASVSHHLEPFLAHCWGSVDLIAETACQPTFPFSEAIDAVMVVYEEGLKVAPALFLGEALVQSIARTCLRTACDKGLPSGLRCLRCLVEASSFAQPSLGQFVSELLTHLVDATLEPILRPGSGVAQWLWVDDPEAVEALFAYLLQHFRSCPQVVTSLCRQSTDAFAQRLLQVSLSYLSAVTDNEALRKILQLIHALLSPLASAPHHTNEDISALHYSLLFVPLVPSLPLLFSRLFALLNTGEVSHQSIWAPLHEALYSLSALSCEYQHQGDLVSALQIVFQLRPPLSEEQAMGAAEVKLNELLSSEDRELVVEVCLQLGQQRNSRRFKSLVGDLGRISNRELEATALQDYRA
jgi:hypothetical protein